MNGDLLNELCRVQSENDRMKEAIAKFKEKRRAVENSQPDAFGHQGKRVQRRQHELREARQRLFEFIE